QARAGGRTFGGRSHASRYAARASRETPMSFTDHMSRGVSNLVNIGPGLPRGPHQMHWPDKHQGRHEGTGPRHFPNGGDKGGGGVTNALDRVVPGTSTPAPGGPPGGPGTIGDNAPLGFDRHETGFRPGG